MTLADLILHDTPAVTSRLIVTKFEPNPSIEEVEIWPDLDLQWPWLISFFLFVSYSRHIKVYFQFHQVWTRSMQVEIDLTLTNVILKGISYHCYSAVAQCYSRFLFTKFEPNQASSNLSTWHLNLGPWPWGLRAPNVNMHFLWPSCAHPTHRCQWIWPKFPEIVRNFQKMHMLYPILLYKMNWKKKNPESGNFLKTGISQHIPPFLFLKILKIFHNLCK